MVGIVTDVRRGGAFVNIGTAYPAFLQTRREYEPGTILSAKVIEVNEVREASLGDERRLPGGSIMEIMPVRVPRVIGKKNSMVKMLEEKTGCDLFVGRNGRIWMRGNKTSLLKKAVLKIEKEAHTSGLTERIKEFLEKGESQ